MHEMLLRMVVGGVVVSTFALLGDVLKPKSFAGLFAAAPSVALATLALGVKQHGVTYGSIEGRSMILGAVAFFLYASLSSWLMMRQKWPALAATGLSLFVWVGTALGMERVRICCSFHVRWHSHGARRSHRQVLRTRRGRAFLAFPAIFPASATFLEKYEEQKKQSKLRAREVAGIDAAGASMGSIGLVAFAIVVWQALPHLPLAAVAGLATSAWLLVSISIWWARKTLLRKLRLILKDKTQN